MRLPLRLVVVILIAGLTLSGVASGAGSTYKGIVDKDKSQKLSFKVSGGKVRKWKAVIYATCPFGGQITVTVPSAKIKKGGKFSRRYQPVKGSETYVTLKGKVKGGKASGTIRQQGFCTFEKQKWSAKRK